VLLLFAFSLHFSKHSRNGIVVALQRHSVGGQDRPSALPEISRSRTIRATNRAGAAAVGRGREEGMRGRVRLETTRRAGHVRNGNWHSWLLHVCLRQGRLLAVL